MTPRKAIATYTEAAFALAVTCAGLSPWPWTALGVAALYLLGLAYLNDKRGGAE